MPLFGLKGNFIFLMIIWNSLFISAVAVTVGTNTYNVTNHYKFKDIQILQWKYGANTCLNFSFDDNNKSHGKISRILEQYGFRGTFFVITSSMYVDTLRGMIDRGHEIGSHTVNHLDLSTSDSAVIDYQLRMSQLTIDSIFHCKCVSFAEPGHQKSELSTRLSFRYYPFIRNYSVYSTIPRERISYSLLSSESLTIKNMMDDLDRCIQHHTMILMAGHGLENEGYVPTSLSLFKQTLDSIKNLSNSGKIWVSRLCEGAQYESLYNELQLEKFQRGDTLWLKCNNYNSLKYDKLDSSMISVSIPKYISKSCDILSKNVKLGDSENKWILTFDLKQQNSISLVLKGLRIYADTLSNKFDGKLLIKMNPIKDELSIYCPGELLSTSIFDEFGKNIKLLEGDNTTFNLSTLKQGLYIVISSTLINGVKREFSNKFIKI
jgi:hypothetical protein